MNTQKLCLGTAQIGLKYGIHNALNRKPNLEESFAILKYAIDRGITCFDTAGAYGDAEAILGKFAVGDYPVKIVTKIAPQLSQGDVALDIQKQVESSLAQMRLPRLDGCLLHQQEHICNKDALSGLKICKERGLVKHVGVSVYDVQYALKAVRSGMIDYIQIPYNVFDQRLDGTDFFELARANRIRIFARSPFLQGLLLMEIGQVPAFLSGAIEHLIRFEQIVHSYGFSRFEAALLFSYSHPHIDSIVFGVDTVSQLELNLRVLGRSDEFAACRRALSVAFTDMDEYIILPYLWKRG